MIRRNDASAEPSIERLIAAETEEAMAKFRKSDFEATVRKKTRAMAREETGFSFPHDLSRPGWIAVAAGIFVIGVISATLLKKAPTRDMAVAIENILRQMPGIQAVNMSDSLRHEARDAAPSPFDKSIVAALAAGRQSFPSAPGIDTESRSKTKTRTSSLLSIEEMYKILVIDKSIERALALIT